MSELNERTETSARLKPQESEVTNKKAHGLNRVEASVVSLPGSEAAQTE